MVQKTTKGDRFSFESISSQRKFYKVAKILYWTTACQIFTHTLQHVKFLHIHYSMSNF